jgi:hypothetical protein
MSTRISYYHAGTAVGDRFVWSDHTRRTWDAAAREAERMARRSGGRPPVEYWSREHGLRPGDQELIEGADWLDAQESER